MSDKDLLGALLARTAPSSTALVRLLTADTAHLTVTAPQPFAPTADHLTHARPLTYRISGPSVPIIGHQRLLPTSGAFFVVLLFLLFLSVVSFSTALQNFSANVQVVGGDSGRSVVGHVAFLANGTSPLVGKGTCPSSYGLAIKLCLLFNLWRTRLREHVVQMQDDRRMSCDAPERRLSFLL